MRGKGNKNIEKNPTTFHFRSILHTDAKYIRKLKKTFGRANICPSIAFYGFNMHIYMKIPKPLKRAEQFIVLIVAVEVSRSVTSNTLNICDILK